jgi:hypothetical protein
MRTGCYDRAVRYPERGGKAVVEAEPRSPVRATLSKPLAFEPV